MAEIHIPTLAEIREVVRDELLRARCDVPAARRLLTVAEAAKLVGVHERTIRRRVAAGELPVVRVGRCVRIERDLLVPPDPMVARLARGVRAA
jgi:excisionase family DNA binding protein